MLKMNEFDKIIAANWKLNCSLDFIGGYFSVLNSIEVSKNVCGIICPPSVYLNKCYQNLDSLYLGAQDCSNFEKGAYTGEISANMLYEQSCQFCLVGHSERRQNFGQTNKDIFIKSTNLINNNINPIICIGETLEERNHGKTKEILHEQVIRSLPDNSSNDFVIIAYEPIWAIGSGIIPELDEIDSIHDFLKNDIGKHKNYKIIYGGSVKSNNSKDIMSLKNVDGLLVGGASLDPNEFTKILKS